MGGRRFWWAFSLLALLSLLPLARTRVLPLLDEPNHLAAITIVHELHNPSMNLDGFYEAELTLVPYVLYQALVHGIAFVTGVEWANKVVLGIYVLTIPLAALWWARRTGRDPHLAFFAFPLAFSTSWAFGFHPFNVAMACFLLASAALDSLLARPTIGRWLLTAILATACALGHPLALLALGGSGALLFLVHEQRLASVLAAASALAPALGLFGAAASSARPGWARGPAEAGWAVRRVDSDGLYDRFAAYAIDPVSGNFDTQVLEVVLVTVAVLVLVDVLSSRRRFGPPLAWLRHHRTALLAGVMLALYVAVPFEIIQPFAWWWVGLRFAPFVCFFFVLVPSSLRGLRALIAAPALAFVLAFPVYVSEKYASFAERVDPMLRMVESTPAGASILCLRMGSRTDPSVNVATFDQIGAWVQIVRGGYSQAGWRETGTLFRVQRELPAPPYWNHEAFDPELHAGPYDFILVHREPRRLFEADDVFRLVAWEGDWKLYRRVERVPTVAAAL